MIQDGNKQWVPPELQTSCLTHREALQSDLQRSAGEEIIHPCRWLTQQSEAHSPTFGFDQHRLFIESCVDLINSYSNTIFFNPPIFFFLGKWKSDMLLVCCNYCHILVIVYQKQWETASVKAWSCWLAILRYLSMLLCQPLAYNLCFHTLKASCSEPWHCSMRESFPFQSVDGCSLTDKQRHRKNWVLLTPTAGVWTKKRVVKKKKKRSHWSGGVN